MNKDVKIKLKINVENVENQLLYRKWTKEQLSWK